MTITIDLDEGAAKAIRELETLTRMSFSQIFSYALTLMFWAFRQHKNGRIVASMDESTHSYRELDLAAAREECRAA